MLNSVLEYQVPVAQAAEVLGVSPRHVRRMLAACREHGAAALAHGNRGRRPHKPSRLPRLPPWWNWPPAATKAPTAPTSPNCSANARAST